MAAGMSTASLGGRPLTLSQAINALSLASALVGNASLLLNMARRVPFSIAQPVTITGFLLAGVLLIADMAALVASHNYDLSPIDSPAANHALSGAFYYAIFASAFYLMIAAAMCLTVYGANRGVYLSLPFRTQN